jgi:hypothetical protein
MNVSPYRIVGLIILHAVVSLSSQTPSHTIAKLGDVATALSAADAAEVLRLADCGSASPWLLTGWQGMMSDRQFTEIFCRADTIDGSLRRGQVSEVWRERLGPKPWGPWSRLAKHRYAQVAPPDRFYQIYSEHDIDRPFRVVGDFSDAELVDLVNFIRSKPGWVDVNRKVSDYLRGDWPVVAVVRKADGTVDVRLHEKSLEWQLATLRRTADGWSIVRLRYVIA